MKTMMKYALVFVIGCISTLVMVVLTEPAVPAQKPRDVSWGKNDPIVDVASQKPRWMRDSIPLDDPIADAINRQTRVLQQQASAQVGRDVAAFNAAERARLAQMSGPLPYTQQLIDRANRERYIIRYRD